MLKPKKTQGSGKCVGVGGGGGRGKKEDKRKSKAKTTRCRGPSLSGCDEPSLHHSRALLGWTGNDPESCCRHSQLIPASSPLGGWGRVCKVWGPGLA